MGINFKIPVQDKLESASRSLTNPAIQVALRPDFPPVIEIDENIMTNLKKVLKAELAKHGVKLKPGQRINIAYPQKHPAYYPDHRNVAAETKDEFLACVPMSDLDKINWVSADSICETRRLFRSKNQDVFHAVTARQEYDVFMPAQVEPLPFLDPANEDKEFFILMDGCLEQGTTLNNLRSFIEHNGGHVLCAVVNADLGTGFVQKVDKEGSDNDRGAILSAPFNDTARNTARLPEMAAAFSRSAKSIYNRDVTPQKCMEVFEKALNRVGNTVFNLTDTECRRLMRENFGDLLLRIHEVADKNEAKKAGKKSAGMAA